MALESNAGMKMEVSIGLMAAYQDPPRPYAGAWILVPQSAIEDGFSKDDARAILSNSDYIDYAAIDALIANVNLARS